MYHAMLYKLHSAIRVRRSAIARRQDKKLSKLCHSKKEETNITEENYLHHTVKHFSSYQLTEIERKALSYGLDQHIPKQANQTVLESEFELFYQNLLRKLKHVPNQQLKLLQFLKLLIVVVFSRQYGIFRCIDNYFL